MVTPYEKGIFLVIVKEYPGTPNESHESLQVENLSKLRSDGAVTLPALRMEEGAMSQEERAAYRS